MQTVLSSDDWKLMSLFLGWLIVIGVTVAAYRPQADPSIQKMVLRIHALLVGIALLICSR